MSKTIQDDVDERHAASHERRQSLSYPELLDVSLLDDAARRMGTAGQALYDYYSKLDNLRAVANDVGHAVLAERSARAELHARVMLSAGLDALNELNDFGLLQQATRNTIAEPAPVNATTLKDALGRCSVVLSERYPEQPRGWLEGAAQLLGDVGIRFEGDGTSLRATVTQNGKPVVVAFTREAGRRMDVASFFGRSAHGGGAVGSAIFAVEGEVAEARSAYDCAIEGLAFARDSVYRHARNAAELGVPARSGAGPAAIIIALVIAGAVVLTIGAIQYYICKKENDQTACKWAEILLTLGLALFGTGSEQQQDGNNSGTSGTRLQFGTNRQ